MKYANPRRYALTLVLTFLAVGCSMTSRPSVTGKRSVSDGQPVAGTATTTTLPSRNFPADWLVYHDPILGFTISYPPNWTVDATQPSCCTEVSLGTSFLSVSDETDYLSLHNIDSLDGWAASDQLVNGEAIRIHGIDALVGDAQLTALGGVDYRHEYLIMSPHGRAIMIDISTCEPATKQFCDQIARSLEFDSSE
jgi:hypothetical protein